MGKGNKMKKILVILLLLLNITGCSESKEVVLSIDVDNINEEVEVYVDEDKLDTLENDARGTYQLDLSTGDHELKVRCLDNEAIEPIKVNNSKYYAYQIKLDNTLKINNINQVYEYTGKPYIEVNNNNPTFNKDEYKTNTYINLSELDSLKRTGPSKACLGKETLATSKRESIGMIKPSGWQTQRYDDLISTKYLYNRCHQIAFMLSGLNAEEKNLMTGTRYFNVNGMLPFEDKVNDYIESTNHHVLYEATPIYKDDELVARGLLLQAASIEDDTIRFNVYIFNIQPGITIDYKTGKSRIAKQGEETYGIGEAKDPFAYTNKTYVINIKNNKYHDESCSSIKMMKDSNKKIINSTKEELEKQGYNPCNNCN